VLAMPCDPSSCQARHSMATPTCPPMPAVGPCRVSSSDIVGARRTASSIASLAFSFPLPVA
jgi:hypothetical protein